ncbi:MAG: endopeptidase La [Christensenellales bacterium]
MEQNLNLRSLPLLPLSGAVLLPGNLMNFDVRSPGGARAVDIAVHADRELFVLSRKDEGDEGEEQEGAEILHTVGTTATVRQVLHLPGGNLRVIVEGLKRAKVHQIDKKDGILYAQIEEWDDTVSKPYSTEMVALIRAVKEAFARFGHSGAPVASELMKSIQKIKDPVQLVDTIIGNGLPQAKDKQRFLEEEDVTTRLNMVYHLLLKETAYLDWEMLMKAKVKSKIDKDQKDYYLREQMRLIKEELGEDNDDALEDLEAKLEALPLNQEARDKVNKELDRLSRTPIGSPESAVLENYLDTIAELPWGVYTKDRINLKRARRILDQDHYGMEEVKERIIEYLAVRSLRVKNSGDDKMKGSILCFVGPPGVGKSSIVKAIAQAMDRKFVQLSLGGVRDEAEIFGHRRTYVGAIPGYILTGIRRAGSMNPVFLLDEIDKLGRDFRGDPASALLEVLDSEQNAHFRDHYLDLPFDLSRVMFVTTANTASQIPRPLMDRMEIIELSSYTEEEKLQIAKKHLVKKRVAENGLMPGSVTVNDRAIRQIIEGYTREAGVRNLSRMIDKVVRKAAVEMIETGAEKIRVNAKKVIEYLGAVRFTRDEPFKNPIVGVVNGLAYTEIGGEMLQVECVTMPGTGKLNLTGQLGDVMKESAQAALSWVRAHQKELSIDNEKFEKLDIHVHVPEGAVPKDGPSAGVTMVTALSSAFTGRSVRQDIAMTGEITLTGRVLPIGGVKEKVLAAFRAGIKRLCLPKENEKAFAELPEDIRKNFTVHYVSAIEDILKQALIEEEL